MLHVGDVPTYKPGEWSLQIFGLVANSFTLSLAEQGYTANLPLADLMGDNALV